MGLFHRRASDGVIEPSPIPVPRFSIDGWTLSGTPSADQARRQPAAPGPPRARDAAARRRRRGRHPLHVRASGHPAGAGRRARPRPVGLRGLAGPPGGALAGVRAAHPGHREAPRPAARPTVRGRRVRAVSRGPGRPTSWSLNASCPTDVYVQMPAKRSRRLVVLDHVARVFEPGQALPGARGERHAARVLRRLRRAAPLPRGRGAAVPRGWPVLAVRRHGRDLRRGARRCSTPFRGLPVHALVVHAVVVLVPLAAVGLIAIAVRPSWRRAYAPLVAILATVGLALVPVATRSGEKLEERLNAGGVVAEQIEDHEDDGQAGASGRRWPCGCSPSRCSSWTAQGRTGRPMTVVAVLAVVAAAGGRAAWSRSPATSGRRPSGSAPSPPADRSVVLGRVPAAQQPAQRGQPRRVACPAATQSSSAHSGSSWLHDRGQSAVPPARSGKAWMTRSRSMCASPKLRRPGVSMTQPPPGSSSAIADDEVCRPRPVTALTPPVARPAPGHQRVDQRRLADAGVADEHADPVAQVLAQLVQRVARG